MIEKDEQHGIYEKFNLLMCYLPYYCQQILVRAIFIYLMSELEFYFKLIYQDNELLSLV